MDNEAAVAGRNRGEVDLRPEAAGMAEHHVAGARMLAGVARPIATKCPDDDVVEAVAIYVASRGYRTAGFIARLLAMDDEAAVAGRNGGEVDLCRKGASMAKYDIAVARIVACVGGAVGVECPNEEVVEAIAIDVAGRGHRLAGVIARVLAMDDEAPGAGRDHGEVDFGREAGGLAEHYVAVAGIGACVSGAVAPICSDDHVVEAVAVDVAGRGYRIAREVIDLLAMDDEAAVAGRDRGEVDLRRQGAGHAEP